MSNIYALFPEYSIQMFVVLLAAILFIMVGYAYWRESYYRATHDY